MPWNAIAYVSSGLTLAAFIVAVVAWVIRSRILAREVSIRSAIENKQNDLIERTLEYFDVDTRGLTRKQKFELAMEQIRARARRFLITMIAVIVVAFLAAGVSIFAIMRATLPISGKSDEDGNRNTPNNTNNVPNVNSFTPTPANNTTATPKPFPSITNGNNAPAGNNAQPIPSPALQNDVRSIQYLACDKEWDFDSIVKSGSYDWFKYSASWDGTRFVHVKNDSGAGHYDTVINYLTWDGTCWQTKWDSINKLFVHKDIKNGNEHLDKVLNYLNWEGIKWTVVIRDNGAEQFFIPKVSR